MARYIALLMSLLLALGPHLAMAQSRATASTHMPHSSTHTPVTRFCGCN